jgi:hypothetical protein
MLTFLLKNRRMFYVQLVTKQVQTLVENRADDLPVLGDRSESGASNTNRVAHARPRGAGEPDDEVVPAAIVISDELLDHARRAGDYRGRLGCVRGSKLVQEVIGKVLQNCVKNALLLQLRQVSKQSQKLPDAASCAQEEILNHLLDQVF